jgi:catechol 2,3-dioxygenase-like lactoylglutathione lyase family enzyme
VITGIDHVVVLVGDLAAAITQYETAGFEVRRGGTHPDSGTENALIAFADGSYLELLAVSDPIQAASHPLWQRADGQRRRAGEYGGFALGTDDIDRDVQRILDRGVSMTPPRDGSRLRPDRTVLRWRVSFPHLAGLPFLIQDITPRDLRIGPPRGGLGLRSSISEVRVAATDLRAAAGAYQQLLDAPSLGAAPATGEVHFVTPRGEVTVLAAEYVAGVHELVLAVADWRAATRDVLGVLVRRGSTWQVPRERTAGARLVLRPRAGG